VVGAADAELAEFRPYQLDANTFFIAQEGARFAVKCTNSSNECLIVDVMVDGRKADTAHSLLIKPQATKVVHGFADRHAVKAFVFAAPPSVQAGSDAAVNATISGELNDQAGTVVVTVFRTSCKRKWREAGPSSKKQRTGRSDVAATTVLADQDLGKKKPNGVGLTTKAGETLSSLHKGDHCAGYVIKYYKAKPAICSITLHYLDMFRLQIRGRGILHANDLQFEKYTMSDQINEVPIPNESSGDVNMPVAPPLPRHAQDLQLEQSSGQHKQKCMPQPVPVPVPSVEGPVDVIDLTL